MSIVLVVDDEYSLVETLSEILAWEGFTVVTAGNGAEGLAALEKERPDLVLLDYMMPVMDGVQMLRAMRANPTQRDIPVVLMTAAPMAVPKTDALWDAMLVKPFQVGALVATVHRFVTK